MKKIHGHYYSKKPFAEYKHRAKVEISTKHNELSFDIYTTNPNKHDTECILFDRASENDTNHILLSVNIVYWVTKEQDDATGEFINECLKDL